MGEVTHACLSPSAAGRRDRCGQFSVPSRCHGGICSMSDSSGAVELTTSQQLTARAELGRKADDLAAAVAGYLRLPTREGRAAMTGALDAYIEARR